MENFEDTFQEENTLSVNNEIAAYLNETTKWAKFLAILGFTMMGIMVLGGLAMIGFAAAIDEFGGMQYMGGMLFFYLLIAVIYIFPLIYLYRFSTHIKLALRANNPIALTSGFENLKSLFKFSGIITIVILSLYILFIVFAVFLGATLSHWF